MTARPEEGLLLMPRKRPPPEPVTGWLDEEQQRAWLAYIRVQLRLVYEMNRQLQSDSGMSIADWDVLTALGASESARLTVTALAAQIGWERAGCPTTQSEWPAGSWSNLSPPTPTDEPPKST